MPRMSILSAVLAAGLLSATAVLAQDSSVTVANAWSRAQMAGRNGAVYLTITGPASGDRLTGASSPVCERVELHETVMDQGVMKMREVTGMAIAPGATVTLQPGGLHIMLIGLKAPLKQGDTVPLTLVFEKSGPVTTEAKVAAAGAAGPDHGHGHR